jgi:hypothetical protein
MPELAKTLPEHFELTDAGGPPIDITPSSGIVTIEPNLVGADLDLGVVFEVLGCLRFLRRHGEYGQRDTARFAQRRDLRIRPVFIDLTGVLGQSTHCESSKAPAASGRAPHARQPVLNVPISHCCCGRGARAGSTGTLAFTKIQMWL